MCLGALLGVVFAILALPGTVVARDDRFDFMPSGGVELLERTLEGRQGCADLTELSKMNMDQPGWRTYLSENAPMPGDDIPAEMRGGAGRY